MRWEVESAIGKAGDQIELTHGGRQFLIEYKKLVDYVAVSGWVRFTERFTSAPRLHDKIDGANLERGAVSRWRKPLVAMQNGRCFYHESHDMGSPEVDHVLPWSFIWRIGLGISYSLVANATTKSGID
jgi:hypothetical protein